MQGNKQKIASEKHTMIVDLDKGMMYALDPNTKTYFEVPFPPPGGGGMMAASTTEALNFKKAGTTREIAGFKCQDYDGGIHIPQGDYTVKECFSTEPPGAEEYAAFQKLWSAKLASGSTIKTGGAVPRGMPIAMDSTMKMGKVNIPGMAPDQAAKINEMMAKRPPVATSTTVEKIESKKLADSEFAIPPGFTKRELPSGSMMMKPGAMKMPPPAGAPNTGASPAAH